MDFFIAPELERKLIQIKTKDKILIKRIEKQLILFQTNHLHPSLRIHKLTGKLEHIWSISIDRNIRMLFILNPNEEAYFFDIGTHDEVYKR